MSTEEIENILRHSPRPEPPTGLKERLVGQINLKQTSHSTYASPLRTSSSGWFRRWWPALSPATVSLACALVFTMQQMEIHDLKQSLAALPQPVAKTDAIQNLATSETGARPLAAGGEEQEMTRLKQLTARLAAEVSQLEQLSAENKKLRTQLAGMPDRLTVEETAALEKARDRAESIACVNNLKQMGLAVRVWALDNNETNPPDVLSMTNELSTPKVLVCPADKGRQPAENWAVFSPANCSYEYLAPAAALADREPQRVLFRCPIHGSVTLCDGSVQMAVAKQHPDWLVERDGKLYFEQPRSPDPQPLDPSGGVSPNPNQQ